MYTDAMKRAVHSLDGHGPKGFALQIIDNDHFLSVRASEKQFMSLLDEDKRRAIEYMAKVKKALEDNGAIVLLVREGGKEL
jgi:nucleotide-binding universal stress UspA family protein